MNKRGFIFICTGICLIVLILPTALWGEKISGSHGSDGKAQVTMITIAGGDRASSSDAQGGDQSRNYAMLGASEGHGSKKGADKKEGADKSESYDTSGSAKSPPGADKSESYDRNAPYSATPKDTVPPKLLSFTVTPSTLTFQGGQITVAVKASDDRGVNTVTTIFMRPDSRQTAITANLWNGTALNGEWRTTYNIPMNTGSTPLKYGIQATVADAANNVVPSSWLTITVPAKPVPPKAKVPR